MRRYRIIFVPTTTFRFIGATLFLSLGASAAAFLLLMFGPLTSMDGQTVGFLHLMATLLSTMGALIVRAQVGILSSQEREGGQKL